MEIINELHTYKYSLMNCNVKKQPLLDKWSSISLNELYEEFNIKNKNVGIRCGEQLNHKFIIALDFDIYSSRHPNGNDVTQSYFETLTNDYGDINYEGVFQSGTEGNFVMLLDITRIKDELTPFFKKQKYKLDELELFISTFVVLPPTKSRCKRSEEMRSREFMSDDYFKDIDDMEDPIIQFIINEIIPNDNTIETIKIEEPPKDVIVDYKLLDLIPTEIFDDYHEWSKIMWVMRNEHYPIDVAIEYSKTSWEKHRSSKFDEDAVKKVFYNPPTNNVLNTTYLKYLVKKYNAEKYDEYYYEDIITKNIYLSVVEFNEGHNSWAKLIYYLNKSDLVINIDSDGEIVIYTYDGLFWVKGLQKSRMLNKMEKILYYHRGKKTEELNELNKHLILETAQDKKQKIEMEITCLRKYMDNISNKIKSLDNNTFKNTILKELVEYVLPNHKSRVNVEFDTKTPDIFVFANVAYNLKTREPYEIKKEDYITISCNYEYIEPSTEDIERIDALFDSILDTDEKRSYISILRSALSGNRIEKFHIANGVGRNGKGVLNELMMACVGAYGYKAPIDLLTKEIASGANPEVANINHKRFVVVNEPNDNQRLLSGNMKRITGDELINARGLYKSDTDTHLDLTLIGEFNKIPTFCGEQDNASIKRLNITEFKNRFTDNEDELLHNKNCKRLDKDLKTSKFKNKYKHALFKYLLDAPDEYYISRKSKELVDEYLKNSNELFIFIDDEYELTESKYNYLSLKEVWNVFKSGDYYNNMTKSQKRIYNYRRFRDNIRHDNELGKYYRDNIIDNDGKHRTSVLIYWREK